MVAAAVRIAERMNFGESCLPAQGRLLQLLADGATGGTIGETGTGCGVGLAWLASGAGPGTRLFSVERDRGRYNAARALFAGSPHVTVLAGNWDELVEHGPFDLLVLDGGGEGKDGDPAVEPAEWMAPGGTLVIGDFTPMESWPPQRDGEPDTARLHWLQHPALIATELRLSRTISTVVARYCGIDGYPPQPPPPRRPSR
jgi:predicted O-methyltransferase YrrM